MTISLSARIAAAALVAGSVLAPAKAEEPSILAGLSGAELLDSGTLLVTPQGRSARAEVFEYLRLDDGSHVLLNTITAQDQRYRVRARFNMDARWQSTSAHALGLYDGKPVDISLLREGDEVAVSVRGDDVAIDRVAVCDKDCLINTAPSATAMFLMTRHYDREKGGAQRFQWAAQDLDVDRTLSGGQADLTYQGDVAVDRLAHRDVVIRHYKFIETFFLEDGSEFQLFFDMWTDDADRPMGFRILTKADRPPVIGFRQGWEDVRDQLLRKLTD